MGEKAIIFAGQGAQFVGMGKDLAEKHSVCADLFKTADDILGRDISKVCFDGPEDALTRSDNAQPAIFVMSIACYKALKQELGEVAPSVVAGLSLGEWSALHTA